MSVANSDSISAAAVASLLRDARYQALESSIASAIGLPIMLDADTATPLAVKELELSDFDISQIEGMLERSVPLAVRFGLELNRGESAERDEEEWDPLEGNQQPDRPRSPSLGLGVGFALSYLIFLSMLECGDKQRLIRYLKARRIPHAASFAKRLRTYYARANAD